MKKFMLTEEQLVDNGFPRPDPEVWTVDRQIDPYGQTDEGKTDEGIDLSQGNLTEFILTKEQLVDNG